MPRTPRSREEIEGEWRGPITKRDDVVTYKPSGRHIDGLILETLLDIRDAVMEGRNKPNTFVRGTSKHPIPEYVSVADAEEMREQGRKAKKTN